MRLKLPTKAIAWQKIHWIVCFWTFRLSLLSGSLYSKNAAAHPQLQLKHLFISSYKIRFLHKRFLFDQKSEKMIEFYHKIAFVDQMKETKWNRNGLITQQYSELQHSASGIKLMQLVVVKSCKQSSAVIFWNFCKISSTFSTDLFFFSYFRRQIRLLCSEKFCQKGRDYCKGCERVDSESASKICLKSNMVTIKTIRICQLKHLEPHFREVRGIACYLTLFMTCQIKYVFLNWLWNALESLSLTF